MVDFVLDFGNARGKYFRPRMNKYGDFRHAIAFLNDTQWRNATRGGDPPEGLIRVNGQPVAIGDAARRYTIAERPKGAQRYRKDYYGVGLAYALYQSFSKNVHNVTLIASHAPGDIDYAEHLRQAALGLWEVEGHQGVFQFTVTGVHTFDEPIGGYSHYTLTEEGHEKRRNQLQDLQVLVVDVGGWTVDIAAIDNGVIDPLSLRSTRTGIINMTDTFEKAMRSNNRTLFQNTADIDIKRIERAILEGEFRFGKTTIDCRNEAAQAINELVNDVTSIIDSAGGAANYDRVLLTGGGAVLIYNTLADAYPRIEFTYAEPDTNLMKYANVFGGAKIIALLRTVGVL